MCGIVGAVGSKDVVPLLFDGMRRLEYRGYDSAGVAVVNGSIQRVRTVGRVNDLQRKINGNELRGVLGIGHTRWATHGGVSEANAHPHVSGDRVAVVHNGIIENYEEQRKRLAGLGYEFDSQTDSEVIAHLLHHHLKGASSLRQAMHDTISELTGAFAIAAVETGEKNTLICARKGCPLVIGLGNGANILASDLSALLNVAHSAIYLEDEDVAEMCADEVRIFGKSGDRVERPVHSISLGAAASELAGYEFYMDKEIHEQPKAIANTIAAALASAFSPEAFAGGASEVFSRVSSIQILAAGSSYYAGLVTKHWVERIARVPVAVDIASEYQYGEALPDEGRLVVTISQSGETHDTIEALKYASATPHLASLTICNVRESALTRTSELVFYTESGPEIGVASTKAFTSQLAAGFVLAVTLAAQKGLVDARVLRDYAERLATLPARVEDALHCEGAMDAWAQRMAAKEHVLFLGRAAHFPIALEGALKLKEISYIHAEAYPAGELKHGPLALVDEQMPVVVLAPGGALLPKVLSNMQEVRARGGELFVFSDAGVVSRREEAVHVMEIGGQSDVLSPIVYSIPVQLLALQTAIICGRDVDKPRNLAKSVTVE